MKTQPATAPFTNHLLASLPPPVSERLLPLMELCPLPLGKVLYESGAYINHLYFPIDSIVSLLYVTTELHSAEIAVVGNDGIVGMAQFLGGDSTHTRAVVQSAGSAYRLSTADAMAEFGLHTDFMMRILRYIQALFTQIAQTAVCNKHHSLEQQLCRWLLLSLDCVPSRDLVMTRDLIANMLGVPCERVPELVRNLGKLGIIEYARGQLRVVDRKRLELQCCECYGAVRMETDRLLFFRGDYHPVPFPPGAALKQMPEKKS